MSLRADPVVAIQFLEKLRPRGPWVLTAIIPDGNAITITAHTAQEVRSFITTHDGKRNLYFSVNPTKRALRKKASKADILAAEWIYADVDPKDDETPEQAKDRYSAALNGFEPKPTAIIDSGNGLQAFWRLLDGLPADRFAEAEARTRATLIALNAPAGTQNVDRIMRLPGTINLPNKKKLKAGRKPCLTKLVHFNGGTYPLDVFPTETPKPQSGPETDNASEDEKRAADELNIDDVIKNGRYERWKGNRSDAVWFVVNELVRRGQSREAITAVLLDKENKISEHLYDQKNPEAKAREQVEKAFKANPDAVNASAIVASKYEWIEPAKIPPREWILWPFYIRKYVSITGAPGNTAKSSLVLSEALALVTGREDLLGVKAERKMKVWLWNGEDPLDELHRRIAALAQHFKIKKEEIGDGLYLGSGRVMEIIIAKQDKNRRPTLQRHVVDRIIQEIKKKQIDVLIIDPLIKVHHVNENDNAEMDIVAKAFSRIAEEGDCSVMLVHHSRKGSGEASTDDLRGASAVRDAAREVRTLNTMTADEAKGGNIPVEERRSYIRIDRGKYNLTPPPDVASWIKLQSVPLANGDNVGVVTPFEYRRVSEIRVNGEDIRRCLKALAEGGPWRADPRATDERWVGIAIASALVRDLSNDQVRRGIVQLQKKWTQIGILREKELPGPGRKPRSYVLPGTVPPTVEKSDAL